MIREQTLIISSSLYLYNLFRLTSIIYVSVWPDCLNLFSYQTQTLSLTRTEITKTVPVFLNPARRDHTESLWVSQRVCVKCVRLEGLLGCHSTGGKVLYEGLGVWHSGVLEKPVIQKILELKVKPQVIKSLTLKSLHGPCVTFGLNEAGYVELPLLSHTNSSSSSWKHSWLVTEGL